MLEDPKTKVAYDTDGVQTVFSIDMPFDYEDEIHAWIRDKTTKLQDALINPDDFFVEDKNLITTAVWAKGYRLVIKRVVTIRQLLQILYGGPLPSEAVEKALDYLTKIALQHEEKFSRALLLPETTYIENIDLQPPEEGFYPRYLSGVIAWVQAFSGNQTMQPFMKVFIESLTAAIARYNIGAAGDVGELSDTEITGPADLDLIQQSGGKWKDKSLAEIFGALGDSNPWRHNKTTDHTTLSNIGTNTHAQIDDIHNSACRIWLDASQDIPDSEATKIEYDNESYDIGSEADVATNHRVTVNNAGRYLVTAAARFEESIADAKYIHIYIFVNGAPVASVLHFTHTLATYQGSQITDILNLAANDYIEIYIWHNAGEARQLTGTSLTNYFAVHRLG